MIRAVFTLTNNLVKRFRYSPTSIIEGREQNHVEQLIQVNELAKQYHYKALIANAECPFQQEKLRVNAEYADQTSNLSFETAWHRIDEIEQRQSDNIWREFYAAKNQQ